MPRSETLLIGDANSYVLPVVDVAAHTTTSKVDGTPLGTGGMHQYDGLGDGAYVAFIRAGGTPASTDEVAGQISAAVNVPSAEENAAAILSTPENKLATDEEGKVSTDSAGGLTEAQDETLTSISTKFEGIDKLIKWLRQ